MTYTYFVVEIIIFLLFLYSRDKSERIENAGMIVACILWTLIFGLRAYCVGNDTPGYAAFFENRNIPGVGYGTVDFPGDTIESGFIIVSRILHFFSSSATFFFTAIAVTFFSGIYLVYRYGCRSNMIWCFLLSNIIGNTFICAISMMRQTMSISVLLISLFFFFRFYSKNQYELKLKKIYSNIDFILFVFLGAFSMLIHRTSFMIFGALLILALIKNNKTISSIIILVSFFSSFFISDVAGSVMDIALEGIRGLSDENISLLGDRYESTMGQSEGMSIIRALSYCVPLLVTIRYTDEKDVNSFFFKCLIAAFVCQLLFSTSYMMNRLSIVFFILGMSKFIPEAAMKKRGDLYWLYIYVTIYYMWRTFVGYGKWPATDTMLPYYFVWQ